ncbi:hypothetical protein JDS87_27270 [Bacillus cereus]|uniref:hypothetical protein n=1 Tax=Bacillus cereus TaxID=1396 RepID=UPI0018F38BD1|nr:hypothetical protein [Bacillus cereus]MBJ8055528.1 hypothetical protein [Bacillus cereus]
MKSKLIIVLCLIGILVPSSKTLADGEIRFWCKKSLKFGHTDITTLQKVCDQYGKGKFVQMEELSA